MRIIPWRERDSQLFELSQRVGEGDYEFIFHSAVYSKSKGVHIICEGCEDKTYRAFIPSYDKNVLRRVKRMLRGKATSITVDSSNYIKELI